MVDIKGNRGGFSEKDMVTEMVLENDLGRKTLNRSDWIKFVNDTEKYTGK